LALEGISGAAAGGALFGESACWASVTPYLHPWHVKKRLTIVDQLRRECRERGLPEPVNAEAFDEVDVGRDRKRRPIHFSRFRSRRGLDQPDRLGRFWHLTFPEPIRGPLALGFACHYGLGLFRPVQ
jgi:CRISPR-associated protein Csb2